MQERVDSRRAVRKPLLSQIKAEADRRGERIRKEALGSRIVHPLQLLRQAGADSVLVLERLPEEDHQGRRLERSGNAVSHEVVDVAVQNSCGRIPMIAKHIPADEKHRPVDAPHFDIGLSHKISGKKSPLNVRGERNVVPRQIFRRDVGDNHHHDFFGVLRQCAARCLLGKEDAALLSVRGRNHGERPVGNFIAGRKNFLDGKGRGLRQRVVVEHPRRLIHVHDMPRRRLPHHERFSEHIQQIHSVKTKTGNFQSQGEGRRCLESVFHAITS